MVFPAVHSSDMSTCLDICTGDRGKSKLWGNQNDSRALFLSHRGSLPYAQ